MPGKYMFCGYIYILLFNIFVKYKIMPVSISNVLLKKRLYIIFTLEETQSNITAYLHVSPILH